MASISESAGALLQGVQAARPGAATLRLDLESGELVVGTTGAAPDDEVLFHAGAPVLRLSAEAAAQLTGCTITTQDSPEGETLAILAPEQQNVSG